jgi:integrase
MARRGENIRKRTDGRWEGRYIEKYNSNGKACYRSVYGTSYSDVKTKLKERKKVTVNGSIINIENLCKEWLENKESKVKQSTYTNYYSIINNHIIPYFKNRKARYLTNETIELFINEKAVKLSEKTVHDIIVLLKQIIKFAVSKKYIEYFDFNVSQPKVKNKELAILSKYEHSKLINYIQLTFDINKIGVLLSLFMGVRIGEVCALKWEDVNFQTETLRINKTMQRIKNLDEKAINKTKIVIDTPKSQKSIREIPIPSFIVNLMKKYKTDKEKYLLTGTAEFIEPRVYQDMFKTYLKESGIEDINYHALRHTFATRAIEQDFDIKSLSEILGHSSVKFTLERYVHPSEEHKRKNMEKMSVFY